MLATSVDSFTIVLSALALFTAVLGALTAFVKLGGDRDSQAVSQAQGANDALMQTLEATERERDYWKRRYEVCAAQQTQIVEQLGLRDRLKD